METNQKDLQTRVERLEKIIGSTEDAPSITINLNDVKGSKVRGLVNGTPQEMEFRSGSNEHCTWAFVHVGRYTSFNVTLNDVEGNGPAVGCVSEWDPGSNGPMIGDAIFYLHSTNRSNNAIRVVGSSSYGNALPIGVGYIAYKTKG